MHLDIEGVPVLFPFDYVYPEQLKYMRELKYAIENKGKAPNFIIEKHNLRVKILNYLKSSQLFYSLTPWFRRKSNG